MVKYVTEMSNIYTSLLTSLRDLPEQSFLLGKLGDLAPVINISKDDKGVYGVRYGRTFVHNTTPKANTAPVKND